MTNRFIQVEVPELGEREFKIYKMAESLKENYHLSTHAVLNMFRDYIPRKYDTMGKHFTKLKKAERKWYDDWIEKVEGLEEQLDSYHRFNSGFKANIDYAIIIQRYAFESDFGKGDLVFNNEDKVIGYAGDIDYSNELFPLYASPKMEQWSYVGAHYREKFTKVGLRKK